MYSKGCKLRLPANLPGKPVDIPFKKYPGTRQLPDISSKPNGYYLVVFTATGMTPIINIGQMGKTHFGIFLGC